MYSIVSNGARRCVRRAALASVWMLALTIVHGSFARAFAQYPAAPSGAAAPAQSSAPYETNAGVPPGTKASASLEPDARAPLDEAKGGRTLAGNPVPVRTAADFPAESRDVFAPMDQRVGASGAFESLVLNREQTQGRNTWILWAGGNEGFWNWLQQHGYGFTDFLKLVASNQRAHRFHDTGLINQPGMAPRSGPGPWGLSLDDVVTPLPNTHGGLDYGGQPWPAYRDDQGRELHSDGVNPAVYGYPSGVVGLRLFPNPDFTAAEQARWDVARYESDPSYYLDPRLVRPFRVGMSCGFCHVGPHPLQPPSDAENPEWSNLSSTIGSQYFKTQAVFGNLLHDDNLIYHYLRSQQPGTIDTSLTATDHINNANTMNAVFDIPARLQRALANPPEAQSAENLRMPSIEDGAASVNPRHTPRVLVDGSDSIGAFGALARVYLNIGTYYEEWNRVQNPVIGVRPQRPFALATCQANSVYWQTNETYRTGYLAAFFTHPRSTEPMQLADVARAGAEPHRAAARAALAHSTPAQVERGRRVFVESCMLCHSSKQPDGLVLRFADKPADGGEWRDSVSESSSDAARGGARAPNATGYAITLPRDYVHWESFKQSPSYRDYVARAWKIAGEDPASAQAAEFLRDNFLSLEQRIPITLVGTNSARAVATNGMRGQVWDNFTSEDYKQLPAVGHVRTWNPYVDDARDSDASANNAHYEPPGGGPGYYRPATLISLWATAPFLHNNALGRFTHDTSVAGRLANFEDGIRKLLWAKRRNATPSGIVEVDAQTGAERPEAWNADAHGWVYRTTRATSLRFPAKFIRELITGVVGDALLRWVQIGIYAAGVLALAFALWTGTGPKRLAPQVVGVLVLVLGLVSAWLLLAQGVGAFLSFPAWLVPLALFVLGGVLLALLRSVAIARAIHVATALALFAVAILAQRFVSGSSGDLMLGPFPRGTPISLILNLDPHGDPTARIEALAATWKGMHAAAEHPNDDARALAEFERIAGASLVRASKCPDYVLDRGHWFGEALPDGDKEALIDFLRTL